MPELKEFYIVKPGGIPMGPYTMAALKMLAMQRLITSEHLYCTEGMSEWLPINQLLTKDSAYKFESAGGVAPAGTSSHLTAAIIALAVSSLLCIFGFPFAVAAVVQASRAKGIMTSDPVRGRHLAESAYFWLIVTYFVMFLQVSAIVIMGIFEALRSH